MDRADRIAKQRRQEDVATFTAQGLSSARIAERLGVTMRTVERDRRELRAMESGDEATLGLYGERALELLEEFDGHSFKLDQHQNQMLSLFRHALFNFGQTFKVDK